MKLESLLQKWISIRILPTCVRSGHRFFGFSPHLQSNKPINPLQDTSHPNQSVDCYASLLRQCTEKASLMETRAIHSQMKASGFPYLTIGNKLVDAYLKCGGIDEARQVFDEMPRRHIVAWNSMISSYIRHGRSGEALQIYKLMLPAGVVPDKFTFSSIFKAFTDLGLAQEGGVAHGNLVVLGLDTRNVFVSSALVDMYVKFQKLKEARMVFDRVVEKDVVLFTALIVGYAQNGEDGKAIEVFGNMVGEGINADEFTFAAVLIACGNLLQLSKGKMIHVLIVKFGFESKNDAQTSLLSMYSKCGLVDDSLKVFEELKKPNLITWTAVIAGLVQNGKEESALKLLCQMMYNSMKPNAFTLSTALRACSSLAMFEQGRQIHAHVGKVGLDQDGFVGAALIDMYGKCGNVAKAREVFDKLPQLDVVSINSLIQCYAQNGQGHDAVIMFDQMRSLGIQPNNATFVSVLSACSSSGLLEEGRRIFASIVGSATNDHYACMVDLLGRAGMLEEAERLIKQVQNPDLVVWRALLNGCRIHGEVDIARRVVKNMLGLLPKDDGTYVLLSNTFATTGNWDEVIRMKTSMREMKLKKEPALSWVEVNRETHTFTAGDRSHPKVEEIYGELERLVEKLKGLGYIPDTRFVLQDMDEQEKKRSLYCHSEKLAISFALLSTKYYGRTTDCIRIFKNLRVCGDCHAWIKLVSKAEKREIIARDAKRFHHFRDGSCSCGDYW